MGALTTSRFVAIQPWSASALRDQLAVAEPVLERMAGQLAEERASPGPVPGQVGGRAVMVIPRREVGEVVGVDVSVRARLEPLRSKLVRLAGLGFRGLDNDILGPVIVTGCAATHIRKLTPGQKEANRVLSLRRAPVERGLAHLKGCDALITLAAVTLMTRRIVQQEVFH
ncbi:hypothetical protein [Streptomyces goshikiensis]|uniref:hypothetical protein n=1 Tax=Streptomyces goshikiensis TaxID=1942 RepID=UPI003669CC44